jgi:cyclophilin family peptidyl-prolyl cis-trans isomerase
MRRCQPFLAAKYNLTIKAWLTFAVAQKPVRVLGDDAEVDMQKVEFELWGKTCPMAVENFARCCGGDMALPPIPASEGLADPTWRDTLRPQLTYKETLIHRVIPGFAVMGGDVTLGTREAGATLSVFGDEFDAPDELNKHPFNAKGLLGTAVTAPHKNHSQFFVLLDPRGAPHLDGTCICFGRVTSGLEFLEGVAAARITSSGVPVRAVRVVDGGYH